MAPSVAWLAAKQLATCCHSKAHVYLAFAVARDAAWSVGAVSSVTGPWFTRGSVKGLFWRPLLATYQKCRGSFFVACGLEFAER